MATATAEPQAMVEPEPLHDGSDRYGIYIVDINGKQKRIAETSLDGIGFTLTVLRTEEQITGDDRVGVLDRVEYTWIVNPYARGRRWL